MRVFLVMLLLVMSNDVLACGELMDAAHDCWNPSSKYVTPGLQRFYDISDLIDEAVFENKTELAVRLSDEYLKLAEEYKKNWNYGNAIHDANIAKGIVELRMGNLAKSGEYLVKASKSPGSPQLDSFGPDLELANVLLKKGQKDQVIEYLKGIEVFWGGNKRAIDALIFKIVSGEKPEISKYSIMYGKK